MDKPRPKIRRRNLRSYDSVHRELRKLGGRKNKLQVESLATTRSGSRIAGVTTDKNEAGYLAVFKEGDTQKLRNERKSVASWQSIYPGLAPQILSYEKRGQSAALLIEHLPGMTFESLVLDASQAERDAGMRCLGRTVRSVWRDTQQQQPVNALFMEQLQRRLDRVFQLHPEFQSQSARICGQAVRGFTTMVKAAAARERQVDAPFAVYIHGDFNLDNIIYDPDARRINFIDLHRSRYLDYVQDVSVFMTSNYRLQTADDMLRERLLQTAQDFYAMARRFARKQKDPTFEWRMALGLARSFVTSTRFVLDKSQARNMYLRGRFLLEKVLDTPVDNADSFRLPVKELFRV